MKELFDINLLSEIKGLDKKLSISKEQLKLRRQIQEGQKYKGGGQGKSDQHSKNQEEKTKENVKKVKDKEGHISIDITA